MELVELVSPLRNVAGWSTKCSCSTQIQHPEWNTNLLRLNSSPLFVLRLLELMTTWNFSTATANFTSTARWLILAFPKHLFVSVLSYPYTWSAGQMISCFALLKFCSCFVVHKNISAIPWWSLLLPCSILYWFHWSLLALQASTHQKHCTLKKETNKKIRFFWTTNVWKKSMLKIYNTPMLSYMQK